MSDPICHRALRRFWFTLSVGPGIGVTAGSAAEARALAEAARARHTPEAAITGVIPDVDVSTLDAIHVVPNAGPVVVRGVWFPRMNL